MTILVICSFAPSLWLFRGHLLRILTDRGYSVIACGPGGNIEASKRLEEMGVKWCPVKMNSGGMNPISDLKLLCQLRRIIEKYSPEIVFNYTIKPVIYGSMAASKCFVPRIYSMITGRGYCFMQNSLKQRLIGFVASCLYKMALRCNRRVIFQNIDDMELFLTKRIIKDRNDAVLVNGSGIDLKHFAQSEIRMHQPLFLLVARLYREKGVQEFVMAATTIKERHPEARFRIVGSIADNPSGFSPTIINQWKKQGIIEHVEWVDDVRPHLNESTVYVLPSYCEGLPRSVLEAMASGRPIVTTDAPGCRETVEEGVNGFLVPARDYKILSNRMERFITDPGLAKKMGMESRRIAEDRFDVELVTQQMIQALEI